MGILDKSLIHLGIDVSTAEEAIRYMGGVLEEQGYVKPGYADRVIAREKDYPTGLMGEEMGFAIPHTSPEYALRPAVCVLVPKRPLPFCMMGTTDEEIEAQVVLPLVITDNKMQLALLKKLMALLGDGENLQKIKEAEDEEGVMRLLAFLEED